jgi:hypothetical protein
VCSHGACSTRRGTTTCFSSSSSTWPLVPGRCMQCRLCRPVSPAGFSRRPCRASRAQAVGTTHVIMGTRMRTALLLERKPVALCAAALLSSPPVLLAPLGSSR